MQDSKTLAFTVIIASLISAAAALLYYMGLLPQLPAASVLALFLPLAVLFLPLAWGQLRRRSVQLLWCKTAAVSAYAVLLTTLTVQAAVPVPGNLGSAVLIFFYCISFLLALASVVYLLIAFWEALADN